MSSELERRLVSAGLPGNPADVINHVFRADYANGAICGIINWLSVEAVLSLKLFVNAREGLSGIEMKIIDFLYWNNNTWEIVFEDGTTARISELIVY